MEAPTLTRASAEAQPSIEAILAEAGVDTKDCYQCGKCSAGCPVAALADMTPREVIRALQLGLLDKALESNMPSMCVGCGMCLARCPQKVDLPSLLIAVRHAAKQAGIVPIKEVERFDKIFVDGVRARGVSDEAMLAMQYNLTTGHFFQDVLNSPKMLTRGMLNNNGHDVQASAEVKALVDRARALENETAPAQEGGAQ